MRRRAARWAALSAVLVALICCLARRTSWFSERVELPLYDGLTRLTWPWPCGHPDIALVTIRDPNQWPITDARLADTLTLLLDSGASCVGVDLLRDGYRPDPADATGSDRLHDLAGASENIIWIRGAAGDGSFGPPPFIDELAREGALKPEDIELRCTLAEFPGDLGKSVRRGYLSATEIRSLSLVLAYIQAVTQHPRRAEEFAERIDQIGGLDRYAGGYSLPPGRDGKGIGDQFLLKAGPRMAELFPDHALEDLPSWDALKLGKAFSGKIVLIGTRDPKTASDEIEVVGDENLRGIKLHAVATAQILRELTTGEAPVRTSPEWLEVILTVLAALLAAAGVWLTRLPAVWKAVLFGMVLPGAWFGAAALALGGWGCWYPPGSAMIAAFLGTAVPFSLLLGVESRERGTMYRVFQRQVGSEIARRIWEGNESLLRDGTLPSQKPFAITALFSDLRGFSTIAKRFDGTPADKQRFLGWLQTYLERMVEVVHDHQGFIKQFAGDGIYVVFGFPPDGSGGTHAADAVRCASEMERTVRELNASLPAGLPPYHVRAGIYTGDVVSVVVGGARQFDYTFIGGAINKASRLEGLHKSSFDPEVSPMRILISNPTRVSLPSGVSVLPFGDGPVDLNVGDAPEPVWLIPPPRSEKT